MPRKLPGGRCSTGGKPVEREQAVLPFQGRCFKCHKKGHVAENYHARRRSRASPHGATCPAVGADIPLVNQNVLLPPYLYVHGEFAPYLQSYRRQDVQLLR